MFLFLRHPATPVWLLLAGATGFSWWFGSDHGAPVHEARLWVTTGIMVVAFNKRHLILYHFMEVRTAPLALKIVCNVWVVAVAAAVLGLYWSTARG